MTVAELIDRLIAAYPGANPEAMRAFKPVYFARFKTREGAHLQAALEATLAEFKPTTRQPFPVPADFERHLPGKIDMGRERVDKLDLAGRKRRADSLFWNWRAVQGTRAARGNPALMRALEDVARPLADVLGWTDNPEPMHLTHDQLKIACQRAISFERLSRFGQPPRDVQRWWVQIETIAAEWGVRIAPEWWDKETGETLANPDGVVSRVERVKALAVPQTALPSPPSPAMKAALMRSSIEFLRDMGLEEAATAKETELAELEAQIQREAA